MKTTKDPIITVRSTMKSKDSKGRDVLTLYIGGEGERNAGQVEQLAAAILALKDAPSGVKLKIHTEKKEYNGRTFDSSFFFVSGVEAAPGRGATPTRFVPKQADTDTASAVANFKAAQIKG